MPTTLIIGILLFNFHLVHVPTTNHMDINGLSHHLLSNEDLSEEDNFEDWLNNAYPFTLHILNNCLILFGTFTQFSKSHCHICLPSVHSMYINSTSVSTNPTQNNPIILCTPKAIAKNVWINLIHQFLNTQLHSSDLSNADYKSFINAATCFFLLNGTLYHQEPHGQHQSIILPEHRYRLIKKAHDDLRHKGVFSIYTCLLL